MQMLLDFALCLKKHRKALVVASSLSASVVKDHAGGNSQNVGATASGSVPGGSVHVGTCKSASHPGGSTLVCNVKFVTAIYNYFITININ